MGLASNGLNKQRGTNANRHLKAKLTLKCTSRCGEMKKGVIEEGKGGCEVTRLKGRDSSRSRLKVMRDCVG